MTDYEVSVRADIKVAVEHKANKDDAYEEAYLATDRIFDDYGNIKLIDITDVKVEKGEYFDFVEIEDDLRVFVSGNDHESAMSEAEAVVKEISLPVGVIVYEAEAYDYDYDYRYDGFAL